MKNGWKKLLSSIMNDLVLCLKLLNLRPNRILQAIKLSGLGAIDYHYHCGIKTAFRKWLEK